MKGPRLEGKPAIADLAAGASSSAGLTDLALAAGSKIAEDSCRGD